MANEKMIMGVPPDKDSNSEKKGGGITMIIIIICVLFAGGFFYLKNKSDGVKEENQSLKIVQQVPKQTRSVKTQEVEIAPSSSIDTPKSPDSANINFENNEQIHIEEQETTKHSVEISQEDPVEDSSMPDQSVVLNTHSPSNLSAIKSPEVKLTEAIRHQSEKNDSIISEAPAVTMQSDDNTFEQPSDEALIKTNIDIQSSLKHVADEPELSVEPFSDKKNTKISIKENILQDDFQDRNDISSAQKAVTIWTVKAGEYLWMISKDSTTFGDPQKWKAIYEANKDQILDANIIYPGQKLIIPN